MEKIFSKNSDEAKDAFADYADEVLPAEISEKAIPNDAWIKRAYASGLIAREEKAYRTAPNITRVESLGPAFINKNWQWCGYDMASQKLGISKRSLHNRIESGDAYRPDIYLGKAWFVPDSYYNIEYDARSALINTNQRCTDCS